MKKIIIISLGIIPSLLFSQTIERKVVNSAGGNATVGNLMVTYSVGETITATNASGSIILSQGFQQGGGKVSAIKNIEAGYVLEVYPIPTKGIVNMDFKTDKIQELFITVLGTDGKSVIPVNHLSLNANTKHSINLSTLSSGNYFIQVSNKEGIIYNTIKVLKDF